MEFRIFWKKWGEPITALSILFFLVFSSLQLYNYNKLQDKISVNCGWGEENYRCMCEKSDVIAVENKIKGKINWSDLENVSLVG